MAEFSKALPYALSHEGGWSDDPDDPGGATNFGITLEVAQHHGVQTKEALRAITPEKVSEIYHASYWRFGGIFDQRVATKIFDMGVNFGLRTAVRMAQEIMNSLGAYLQVDGIMGPNTESCINAVDPEQLLQLLCMACENRYLAIVDRRPASAKYLKGWLHRALELPNA